jgi:two-component system chemotaxis sensor kinase CheA
MVDLSLLQDFITEASEHLEQMEGNILRLESDAGNKELLNDIFRSAHTIKGASDYLGLRRIAELSHKMEGLLDLLRQGERDVDRTVIDILIAGNDRIAQLMADLGRSQSEEREIADIVSRIEKAQGVSSDENAVQEQASDAAGDRKDDAVTDELESETDDLNDSPEIYQEEYDQELFQIFVQQLCEGLENIRNETHKLSEPPVLVEFFNCYQTQLESLLSSANYMGYDRLADVYKEWRGLLEDKQKEIGKDNPIPIREFWQKCMQPEINKVVGLFQKAEALKLFLVEPELCDQVMLGQSPCRENQESDDLLELGGLEDLLEPDDSEPKKPASDDGELTPIDDESLLLDPEDLSVLQEDKGQEKKPDPSLLQDFITEASEHLEQMEGNILRLESDTGNKEVLNDIFRSAHTIKGASDYLGLRRIAELSHKLEGLLDLLRQGERDVDKTVIDVLIAGNDRIAQLMADLGRSQSEESEIADIVSRIEKAQGGSTAVDAVQEQSGNAAVDLNDRGTTDGQAAEVVDPVDSPEIYLEEYDQELFQIFIQQLCEELDFIENQAKQVIGPTDANVKLDGLVEKIKALKSSANYMGYEKIVSFYRHLENAISKLGDGNQKVWDELGSNFYQTHIQPVIQKVVQCFPSVSQLQRFAADQSLIAASQDKEAEPDADLADDLPAVISDHELLIDQLPCQPTDNPQEPAQEPESGLSDHPGMDEIADQAQVDTADQALFDRLGQAFDRMMDRNEQNTVDGLDREIESVLFSSEKQLHEAQDALFSGQDDRLKQSDEPRDEPQHEIDEDREAAGPDQEDDFEAQLFAEMAMLESQVKTELKKDPQLAGKVPVAIKEPENKPEKDETVVLAASGNTQKATLPAEALKKKRTTDDTVKSPIPEQKPEKSVPALKQSIRIDAAKIDTLMNQVGELVVNRAFFSQLYNEMKDLQHYLAQSVKLDKKDMKQVKGLTFRLSEATISLGRVANELQEGVMRIRMLPISQLFSRYPRLVHDLVRESGKQVNLDIRGEDTELDKMVIEQIADPLIHIIRNSVDHGIEMPDVRKKMGKPEAGRLSLEAYHESNHVVIEVNDDGKGIDVERVKAKAIEKDFLKAEELAQMSLKEIYGLIMLPGFSTADRVTHTSGRGVGMDVVKKNVEKLNGTIEIESKRGVSTRFRIKIPLTLAIIPALLVKVDHRLFTIPLSVVDETIRVFKHEISTIEGIDVIHLREQTIPLIRLAEAFNMRQDQQNDDKFFVVIVSTGVKRVGLMVDSLLGQEEVVIKPLEDYLQENSGFSGATILGDGQISLILDVYELIRLCIDKQTKRKLAA